MLKYKFGMFTSLLEMFTHLYVMFTYKKNYVFKLILKKIHSNLNLLLNCISVALSVITLNIFFISKVNIISKFNLNLTRNRKIPNEQNARA